MAPLLTIENQLLDYINTQMSADPAHDSSHLLRVVSTAKKLSASEGAIAEVVVPAAYLHDCIAFPKDHPQRAQSSKYAADQAVQLLTAMDYPGEYLDAIHHAIVAHSFSANVACTTIEAQIVQDADRLDALGAVGIARCVQVGVKLERPLYRLDDPFCASRDPDDFHYTIDHFYTKLLTLAATMNTNAARQEANRRITFMQHYLQQLESEVS